MALKSIDLRSKRTDCQDFSVIRIDLNKVDRYYNITLFELFYSSFLSETIQKESLSIKIGKFQTIGDLVIS